MSHSENTCLYVPKGYLHGYQVSSDSATICYQIKGTYSQIDEVRVNPKDPFLNIQWRKLSLQFIADKDKNGLPYETRPTSCLSEFACEKMDQSMPLPGKNYENLFA